VPEKLSSKRSTMPERGILLAEDEALKAKLSGLLVSVPNSDPDTRRVKVWYGMPSTERDRVYPFITIDLIDIVFATDRVHSAQIVEVDWWPSTYDTFADYAAAIGLEVPEDAPYGTTILFQPYDIYYQVATHSRSVLHDRQLTAMLLSGAFLPLNNFGYLHVPADDTQRWLDNLGWASADYRDAEDKVVRRKVYTVKVSAHMAVEEPQAVQQVLAVYGAINGIHDGEEYAAWQHAAAAE
jgi:hypothetical protein